ncbi:MAG: methyltransferase domain-containing protein [Clostridia bacterium]|nr:methyltransferase domain-containing protein [Clostridia bacterium]
MIKTQNIPIDLGGHTVNLTIVKDTEEILVNTLEDGETPVWVELWPSAIALARWYWQGPDLSGLTVLELGAGLGLPGLAAALKGAQLTQTDYIPEAVDLAQLNARQNGVADRISHMIADWRNFTITEKFDIITGSDFLYQPLLHPYLKNIFENNLKTGGRLIIGEYGRTDALQFIQKLISEGWKWEKEVIEIEQGRFRYATKLFVLQR